MSVILPCPRCAGVSLTVVFSQLLHQILEQKKAQVEHCHCKHFNIPPSHLSPPSSFSVCHPPSTRPPARLLLQTQLRGRLDLGDPPHTHRCEPWRPQLFICFSFSSFLPPPPLQHHCSIPHLSSARPEEPLFFSLESLDTRFTSHFSICSPVDSSSSLKTVHDPQNLLAFPVMLLGLEMSSSITVKGLLTFMPT